MTTRSRAPGAPLRLLARAPAELAALAAGCLLSFCQAPWPPPVALTALFAMLAVAFVLFDGAGRPWRAARIGWCLGFGYFFTGLWWIGAAFDIYADQHGWMKPFAVTLLPAFLALFWGAAFGAAHWASARLGAEGWRRGLWLVAIWSLVEFARGGVLTGFPWSLFAYAWLDTPAAQIASWIGSYGLNALTLAVALTLGRALRTARDGRWPATARMVCVWAAAGLALNAAGWARLPGEPPRTDGAVIRLVQPNVPQARKTDRAFAFGQTNLLANMTAAPGAGPVALVVWPESSARFLLEPAYRTRARLASRAPDGASLVIGAPRYEPSDRLWRNSLYVVGPDGAIASVYDKRHLVPFGEVVPFRETLRSLGLTEIASPFEPGVGDAILRLPDGRRFLALICYEAVFPTLAASPTDQRPDFILHLTNDAWFGDSGGPWQHLAQTRFRAIEQGLPIYRAANTGVSASIDGYGRLVAFVALDTRANLDAALSDALTATLYARVGESVWLSLLSALVALLSAPHHIFRKKQDLGRLTP